MTRERDGVHTDVHAGAPEESEYVAKLARAGFVEIGVEPTRIMSGVQEQKELANGYAFRLSGTTITQAAVW